MYRRKWRVTVLATYISDVRYSGRYSHKPHGEAFLWILGCPVGVHRLHPAHHHFQGGTTGCVFHHMHLNVSSHRLTSSQRSDRYVWMARVR